MNISTDPCQFLEWDTSFFGKRIARMNGGRLTLELLNAVYSWCEERAIACLYFLADSDDPGTIRLAEDYGFRLVEIRYILERSLRDWDPKTRPHLAEQALIRLAKPEDIPDLQEIARTSYVDSRYYFDKNFPEAKWQDYYSTWVKKSVEGGADFALVAELEHQVVGYITGLVDQQTNQGIYELTGVREQSRRFGIGQELFRSGIDWYVEHGVESIRIATQGRNVTTQRMIQRHDFLSKSCQLYYHKWFLN